jgi:hypothetical protein
MAHITIRQTQLVLKNGNKAILEENCWEFCDDLWRVIKEFAGITGHTYNINLNQKMVKFWRNIEDLVNFCPKTLDLFEFIVLENPYGTQAKMSKMPNEVLVPMLKKEYKARNFSERAEFLGGLVRLGAAKWTLEPKWKVGDEVQYYRNDYANDRATEHGVIVNIAADRSSVKVRLYEKVRQTSQLVAPYESRNTWTFDKTGKQMKTFRSSKVYFRNFEETHVSTSYHH